MIAAYLHAKLTTDGLGTGHYAAMPDTDNLRWCLYDESAPVSDDSQGFAVEQWGVKVHVRGAAYAASRDLTMRIHALLAGWSGTLPTGGPIVHQTFIMTSPSYIGRDEKERHEWTAHYMMRCEGATGGSISQTRKER